MDYNNSQAEKHVLLIIDADFEKNSLFTFKSLTIPFLLTLTYILLLIWSIRKDKKDKMSNANIDLKSTPEILQEQPPSKPYNRWDPNRTQENWTNVTAINVTAMNVTSPNAGLTDRIEEDNSISIAVNKSSNLGTVSRVPTHKRSSSFDGQPKTNLELKEQPANTNVRKKSVDGVRAKGRSNSEIPHNKLVETLNTEGETAEQRADTHILRTKRRQNFQTKVEKPLKKESFRSKFLKLATDRNSVLSFYFKTSKIFPRYKRLTLIFLLIELNLFMTSTIFLSGKPSHRLRPNTYLVYLFLNWLIFVMVLILTRVSKDRLKTAIGFEDFLLLLEEVRKEGIVKMVILAIIFTVFTAICFSQLMLFAAMYSYLYLQLVIAGAVMSVIHLGIFDLLWCAVLSLIYVKGYDSEGYKDVYKCLNITAWKI